LGLQGRVYRIYPSLVRDVHFAVYLRENLREGRILYNLKLDAVGTDIMLFYKDLNYGLRLFVNTYNSNRYKNKKDMNQTLFDNVTYIDLTLNLGTADSCGEFKLYGKEHLQKVEKESNMKGL